MALNIEKLEAKMDVRALPTTIYIFHNTSKSSLFYSTSNLHNSTSY